MWNNVNYKIVCVEYFLSKLFSLAKLCDMALQQKGWTQTELAKYLGLQQSTVSKILRGHKSSLDEDRISMLYDLVGNVSEDSPALRTDHYATVQQYDVIASAGYGSFIHGETGEEVLVRTEWLPNSAAQRNLSCIKISGDSMLPTIGSDDHVVHELDQRYSGPGLYVVRHRDTLLCKRLEVLLNGNIKIKSDNNVYSEEVLQNDDPDAEQFAIIGRVRLIMRKP